MVSLSEVDGRAVIVVEGVTDEGRFAVTTVFPLEMSTTDTAEVVEMIASVPLPTASPVHYASVDERNQLLAMLSTAGEISIFSTDLTSTHNTTSVVANETADSPTPLKKKKASKAKGLPSLKPLSTVSVLEGKEARQAGILALAFTGATLQPQQDVDMDGNAGPAGELVIGRMGGGGRLLWEKVVSGHAGFREHAVPYADKKQSRYIRTLLTLPATWSRTWWSKRA